MEKYFICAAPKTDEEENNRYTYPQQNIFTEGSNKSK